MTTKIGTTPNQGDIVLIPVPFTDLTSKKRRPVIVLSNDDYNRRTRDIVVVALTSRPEKTPYSFQLQTSDLEHGRLNRPGQVRVDKIYTLSQSIIVKTFGRVNSRTVQRIRALIRTLTALSR